MISKFVEINGLRTGAWALAGALFFAAAANAQETTADMIQPVGALDETFLKAAKVSGEIVVGLQLLGSLSAHRPALAALVPAEWAGRVMCARVNSEDGLYSAQQEYHVDPAWAGGLSQLTFDSEYTTRLNAYEIADMAARVNLGTCADPEKELGVAAWNLSQSEPTKGAVLLVNSFRAEEVYLIDIATGKDYDCHAVTEGQRTSFDTRCPLPLRVLKKKGELRLEVNRLRRGQPDPAEIITIVREIF